MKTIFYILLSLLLISSCSTLNITNDVKISQVESNYPIVLKLREDGTVWAIFFPLVFKMSKRTLSKVRLSNPNYLRFNEHGEWLPTVSLLFYREDKDLIRLKDNDKLRFLQFGEREWVVYARYSNLSKEQHIQEFFISDLKRAKSEHKDTLHIGSIQQLKQTNPKLLNDLLQRDSIEFSFYYKDNFHDIILPVEIK